MRRSGFFVLILTLLLLAACDAPTSTPAATPTHDAPAPTNTPTATPAPTQTPTSEPTNTPAPTNTPKPTATPSPTPTKEATPTPAYQKASLPAGAILRTGPGQNYDTKQKLDSAKTMTVLGQTEVAGKTWLRLAGNNWIDASQTTGVDLTRVPAVDPADIPATPTPAPTPTKPKPPTSTPEAPPAPTGTTEAWKQLAVEAGVMDTGWAGDVVVTDENGNILVTQEPMGSVVIEEVVDYKERENGYNTALLKVSNAHSSFSVSMRTHIPKGDIHYYRLQDTNNRTAIETGRSLNPNDFRIGQKMLININWILAAKGIDPYEYWQDPSVFNGPISVMVVVPLK